jgi:energy-coupling factor transporter transmembrane protein EcfT
LCAGVLIVALIVTNSLSALIPAAAAAALFSIAVSPSRRAHLRFILWFWLPLTLWLVLVWGWIVAAPPGAPLQSDRYGGILYSLRVALRLEAMVGTMQVAFLSMTVEQVGTGLRSLRIPDHVVFVIMSVFALGPELRKRADQVLTARIARGLLPRRSRWQAVRNLASTLMPLVAWGFRSATVRADYWAQRQLLASPQLTHRVALSAYDRAYVAVSVVTVAFAILNSLGVL